MAPHADDQPQEHSRVEQRQSKPLFTVDSPNVCYTDDEIRSKYTYRTTEVTQATSGQYVATPKEVVYDFKVDRKIGKVGMMLVGWGGSSMQTSSYASDSLLIPPQATTVPL